MNGIDGKVKFNFSTTRKLVPEEDEKGNVDFKNIQLIQNVKKGDKLAEVTPPVPGKEGRTVLDERVVPELGKVAQMPLGANTEISADNPNILISGIDGNVMLKSGLVMVDSVYIIPTSIDFQTGNVQYVGSLHIKGDVKSGFEVQSDNDIQIDGLVEDAKIVSGGNVIIKKGFIGKGNGLIDARGDVILKFCENQNIKAKGNIIVGEAVLHCNLTSESSIEVQGSKGTIVGGVIRATKGLVVKDLGNYQEVKTEVIAGVDDELLKKLDDIEEQRAKSDQNMGEIKKAIYVLYKKKMKFKKLPQEQEQLLHKLQGIQENIPTHKIELEEKKKKIEEEMKKYKEVTIDVLSKVNRGVRISLLSQSKVIKDETTKVRFRVDDNEIVEVNL